MSSIQEPQIDCQAQTVSDEYRSMVKSLMPAMAKLLDLCDAGVTPTFLDVWGALSEYVAFHTDCDLFSDDEREELFLMSGKYCRFCC